MADIRYVDLDYVVTDYLQVGSDTDYLYPDYLVDGYVGKPATSAEAALAAAFVTTVTPSKTRPAQSSASATATFTAQLLRVRPAASALTSTVTVSFDADDINGGSATFNVTTSLVSNGDRLRYVSGSFACSGSLSADCDRQASAQTTLTTSTTLFARGGYFKTADSSMSAFNTTLTTTARIRSTQSDMTVSTALTAGADRIRYVGTQNNLETINPTPYTGISLDRTSHFVQLDDEEYLVNSGSVLYTIDGADDQDQWIYDAHFVFWLRFDDWTGGTVLSSPGTAFNFENAFRLAMTPSQVNISYGYSAGTTGGWSTQFNIGSSGIQPGEWHHYVIQVDHTTAGSPSPWSARIWVDGVETDVTSGTYVFGNFIKAVNPITIGAQHNIDGTYGTGFSGAIEQLWIANNCRDAIYEFYNYEDPFHPFIDYGENGRQTRPPYQLTQPAWYEKFDYPYTNDVIVRPWANPATTIEISSDLIPQFTFPVIGIFSVVARGDNVKYAQVNASSQFTFDSLGNYAKFGEVAVDSQFDFAATSYDFTKATVSISSAFTQTLQPGNALRNASAAMSAAFTVTDSGSDTNKGEAHLSSAFTVTADSTTAQLGRMSAQAAFNLAAQTYEFTKASVVVSASATLEAEGRLEERERGNLLSGMEFTLTASISTTKVANSTLSTVASISAFGGLTRPANVSMSALAFDINAGRILGIQIEQTYKIAKETGVLLVQDLEDTILLVADSTELNSILVADDLEDTVLQVAQETGQLLVQS